MNASLASFSEFRTYRRRASLIEMRRRIIDGLSDARRSEIVLYYGITAPTADPYHIGCANQGLTARLRDLK